MSISPFCICLLFLIFFLFFGTPSPARSEPSGAVFETRLSNGMVVLLNPQDQAPVVSLQIWYNVGSRNEPYGRSGLAHLTEHLMFRGTEKVGPKQFFRTIQKNGGQNNAFTSRDYTVYYESMAPDRLSVALELEADRMTGLSADESLFLTERKVVQEERRLRIKDDPTASLFEEVLATAFKSHPYRSPVTGWMEDLERLTYADFLSFYRTHYAPSQALLIVSGRFDRDGLLPLIEKTFGKIPAGPVPPSLSVLEPPQEAEKRVFMKREETRLPYAVLAFHTPSFPHPDAFSLKVMAQILGRSRSSRLYEKMVYREQKALGAGASYAFDSRDPFLFLFYAQAMPDRTAEEMEQRLLQELEDWGKNPPTEEEMNRAKNQIEAEFIFGQDSVFNQGLTLGKFQGLGSWKDRDAFLPRIKAVTAADLRRVYETYFRGQNKTTGLLTPLRSDAPLKPSLKQKDL
jgi:zinc protease